LFRPLIKSLELLTYLRLDPRRIQEALGGKLPKAGDVAKKIEGKFKELREFLNTHASHLSLSLSPEAMFHLVDLKSGRLRRVQAHKADVLRQNLRTLLAVLSRRSRNQTGGSAPPGSLPSGLVRTT
jgi:hypothetical protein